MLCKSELICEFLRRNQCFFRIQSLFIGNRIRKFHFFQITVILIADRTQQPRQSRLDRMRVSNSTLKFTADKYAVCLSKCNIRLFKHFIRQGALRLR